VIVPTRDEAQNVAPLIGRLSRAVDGLSLQVIFVDDSSDDTPARVSATAATSTIPVRLIHRARTDRVGGLGSAVLVGLRAAVEAGAAWAVVMDGDLQHPPELVAQLVKAGRAGGADLVVASRYAGAGSAAGLSDVSRAVVSGGATRLSRAAFPRRLRDCTDPMSGFFAIHLATVDLDRLRPRGFKILLEIVGRQDRMRIVELPFVFAARVSGQSKASWREGLLFARRLAALRVSSALGRYGARARRLAGFAAAGATGVAVNSAALWLLVTTGMGLLPAAVLATQASTAWNFLLTDRLVFRTAKARPMWLRLTGFAVVNNAALLLRIPLLSWLAYRAGLHYLVANGISLLALFTVRYVIADLYLFTSRRDMSIISRTRQDAPATTPEPPALRIAHPQGAQPTSTRSGPTDRVVDLRPVGPPGVHVTDDALRWRYSIHDLITIASVTRLSELDHFAAPDVNGPFDIRIQAGCLERPGWYPRARVTQFAAAPAVSYEEHTGRLGTDFLIDMRDGNITVTAGRLLVSSPHVLYTNIVEALLRFVFVARGRVLLHSACLDLGGRGVMLSARTDTGKTGTVLRLLREEGGAFLSDDMTVLDADGTARCFPKPMTISQHTLRAVDAGDLTQAEWRRLRVQSRLHSKQGRGIGARLGEMNLPIMCLNAVTQRAVPPPKYMAERLVPCRQVPSVRVEDLFVIERGAPRLDSIDPDRLIDELIDNTDDAYEFPPFRYFAPALVIDGADYEELRARERRTLTRAMATVRARRLVSPDFSWADRIPTLAGQ